MRRNVVTINAGKFTRLVIDAKSAGSWGLLLAACTLGIFLLASAAGMLQSKWLHRPLGSMKGMAAALPDAFFSDLLDLELHDRQKAAGGEESSFSARNVGKFVFAFLTGVRPWDPKSLVSAEVPLLDDNANLLSGATAADVSEPPSDYTPPSDALQGGSGGSGLAAGSPDDPNAGAPASDPGTNPDTDAQSNAGTAQKDGAQPAMSTHGRKVVFIYHTHNRESYLPALKDKGITDPDKAYDAKINVTLLGRRLADRLNALGVGAVDSAKDYPTTVKDFNYNFSYKYSLQTLKEATAVNRDYQYFFDIHRDSGSRKETTATINGVSYAQVYFIIGQRNPGWEKNEAFAESIHRKLESLYPGLSKGLWGKGPSSGNAEYNQSFSSKDILIEVGGPENTLEECDRTIDALAKAIASIYWDAEKVDASAGSGKSQS